MSVSRINISKRDVVIAIIALLALGNIAWAVALYASPGSKLASENAEAEKEDGQAHGSHNATDSIELSPQGLKNIGYEPHTVALGEYTQMLRLPAMVAERPGRTQLEVTARVTGVVTQVHFIERQTVIPGEPLFELRLTHEELVTSESQLLADLADQDVVQKELVRLKAIAAGVIPEKRIIEQEYALEKLKGSIAARSAALEMHGLTKPQVNHIKQTRTLVQDITIYAPQPTEPCPNVNLSSESGGHLFQVQSLNVKPGQQVEIGAALCVLSDHCELYIEGIAFEQDIPDLTRAANEGTRIKAYRVSGGESKPVAEDLFILSLGDVVESDSRAFHFYVPLGNELERDQTIDGERRISWKFKPGQRLELAIPITTFKDIIELPLDAVVDEGAESYVFQQNGKKFDRTPVHVQRRDRKWAVVANDGSLFPGDIIAGAGAYQIHLAIKNAAGGGVDAHHGHSH